MSTMDMSGTPISSLARSLMETDASAQAPMAQHTHEHGCDGHGWWSLVFWWIVIALILYFVLFALRPDFVLEKDDYGEALCDEIDQGKLLGSAIVLSLIIVFVLFLFAWGFGVTHY